MDNQEVTTTRWPSDGKWVIKMWYVHTMEFSAIKSNEGPVYPTAQMGALKTGKMKKIRHEKTTYYPTVIWSIQKRQSHRDKMISGCLGEERNGRQLLYWVRISLRQQNPGLEMDGVYGVGVWRPEVSSLSGCHLLFEVRCPAGTRSSPISPFSAFPALKLQARAAVSFSM